MEIKLFLIISQSTLHLFLNLILAKSSCLFSNFPSNKTVYEYTGHFQEMQNGV